MKIALLTTDNRWPFNEYYKETPWFGMAPEALLQGFVGIPDLEVHVVSCIRKPVKSPEKLAENIWFHSLYVPKFGWMRTGYQGCIRVVRRRLRLIKPDLVHGQGTEAESAICAAFSGFPNVITLLGIMKEMARILNAHPGSFYWMASLLESLALRRTAGVLCNSRFTEAQVRGRTPKTWLVPNAVREVFFEKPLAPARPGRCTLLNVGSISSYKRQNELLDVAEQLHAEGLDFQLEFVGQASTSDPYVARFLSRVQNQPRVTFHGFKSMSEVMEFYDRASALVHVSAVESFGLVVAEALSRNLKFIGFNSGGVADIVAGVEGAESFRDGDWTGVKSALRRWIQTGAARPGTAAATMRQRYHPTNIARQHVQVYCDVLGRIGEPPCQKRQSAT
ncbi:MAG: glycosyltransferase family 4 protein [Verrucomicrobia bacterium]|nr:glycosyltransferase family 4 protein [Verrucomicrobiota bacterium]